MGTFRIKASRFFKKNGSVMLLGTGIAGMFSSLILAAKGAVPAKEALDELHKKLGESDEEMTKSKILWEEFKTAAPYYAPSAGAFLLGAGCAVGSYKMESSRAAALAGVVDIAQSRLVGLEKAAMEVVDEKTMQEIKNKVAENMVKNDPPGKDILKQCEEARMLYSTEEIPGDGRTLFRLGINGRYFRSSREEILRAVKRISDRLSTEMWVSLNEFQYELGLSNTDDGEYLGFSVDDGIDVDWGVTLTPNGEPCQVVEFIDELTPYKLYT